MKTWVSRSFALVKKGGYLDKLTEIYPPPPPTPRSLSKEDYKAIEKAFRGGDDCGLLQTLLEMKKFPFNDPYVSFLRQSPREIKLNPKTAKRICDRLRQMGMDGVVAELEEPPEFNRQMGAMFSHWLHQKFPFVQDADKLIESKERVIFLDGSGERLRQFANEIGCGIQKQPDFIAHCRKKLVIGEAKFIGTEGGNQNRAFEDAMKLASSSFKEAVTVAVLDGIVWIPDSGQMSRKLANFSGNALTALLLDDFISSF